jgi:lipopolysaccharide transport system ATP-binding protein
MSSEIAIRVQNLSKCYQIYDKPRDRLMQMLSRGRKKYYREFWALQDVSFEIKKGETFGVIGRNGSGKSTLLQLLCGTLNPTNGSIEVNGKVAALLELGAGFNPEFTGRENVFLSASLYGLSREEITQRFDRIVEFAEIGDFVDQPVKTYSSGMFVRLAFAVIAHVDADILVIDEALAVGDAFFVQKCMRFLREFIQRGTLIFVSHDSAAIVGLCSSAMLLDKGVVQFAGHPKKVTDYYLASLHEDHRPAELNEISQQEGNAAVSATASVAASSPASATASSKLSDEFGIGGVKITSVKLKAGNGAMLASISGGEKVILTIECVSGLDVANPIVGFLIRDRLGQVVFGTNTLHAKEGSLNGFAKNSTTKVALSFDMPTLQVGDYSLGVAVAEGTQLNHVQHHWIHDALIISFRPSRPVAGIFDVELTAIDAY